VKRTIAAVWAAAALTAAAPAAWAAAPRTTLNDVEDEVMCVACNVPLNIAEAPQADRERAEIRRLIAQGLTKEQIKQRLKAIYGPNVIALPESSGFNLAAYLVPIALVAAMVAAVAVLATRWRRRDADERPPPADPSGAPPLDAADERRLEDDLARSGL
jgi:cytochrome c-type biogenesis protein CcmH/NrfF